jgi:alpha-tubulin suppressor-like RCC1 family protein
MHMPNIFSIGRRQEKRQSKSTIQGFLRFTVSVISLILLLPNAEASVATVIGAGYYHSCAALAEGGLKCWGDGVHGELGDGTRVARSTAGPVPALANFHIIAVGGGTAFTCALTSTGAVYCWGSNDYGQLGNGTYVASLTPVAVQLPTGPAVGLSVASNFACLLDSFGNVYCWGGNNGGQLNRSVTMVGSSNVPIYAAGQNDIVALAGTGIGTCVIDSAGGDKCFGNNSYGQKGIGSKDAVAGATYGAPAYVTGLSSNVLAVAAGTYDSCAVTTTHIVSCWGQNTVYAQLGFTGGGNYLTPVTVSGVRNDAKAIFAQQAHTCITTINGAAQCWGQNAFGQLGRGTTANAAPPGDVLSLTQGVSTMALGLGHTCAVLTDGTVKCWGENNFGQVGNGTTTNRLLPTAVSL